MNRKHFLVALALVLGLGLSVVAEAACTLVSFKIAPDASGTYAAYLRPPSQCIYAASLVANTEQDFTVPTGANWVILASSCAAFYARQGGSATVPGGNITDGTGSSLNPSGFGGFTSQTLGMVSPTTCIVTMDFYK